jgi:prefoldin subunit 5
MAATPEEEVKAGQQEIDRLLERDRVWRDEVADLQTQITVKNLRIAELEEVIDAIKEVVSDD